MKTYLKISLLIAIFAIFTLSLTAQIDFGVKAGLNYSNVTVKDHNFKTKSKVGYHFGGIVTFGDKIGLQTGLLFSLKGWNDNLKNDLEKGVTVKGYSKTNIYYVEIPINLNMNFSGINAFFGPYIGIPISGKNKFDYTVTNTNEDPVSINTYTGNYKIKFLKEVGENDLADNEEALNPLDFGINLGVGYKFDKFLINAGYSLGLANLTPGYAYLDKNYLIANRIFNISLSYFLNK